MSHRGLHHCWILPLIGLPIAVTGTNADSGPRIVLDQTMTDLAGTTWVADDGSLGRVTYYFERGGVLSYTYPNGAVYRNGTWEQRGDVLYFEANQKYREFRARVQGTTIRGPSWNKAGERWETTLKLAKPR